MGTIFYLGFLAILFIWIEFFHSAKEEHIVLTRTISDDNESKSLSQATGELARSLNHSVNFIENHKNILSFITESNLSKIKDELVELDKNQTTFEIVIFRGDLNASIKKKYDFWIVQYEEENFDNMKTLLADKSDIFPIVINIKKDKKWATIQTEHNGTLFKEWEFIDGQYREDKSKCK